MAQQSHHFASSSNSANPCPLSQSFAHSHESHHAYAYAQQQPTPGADDQQARFHHHHHDELCRHDHDHEGLKNDHFHKDGMAQDDYNISIHAGSKHAEMAVETFLAEHIPTQYNPIGAQAANEHDPLQQQQHDAKQPSEATTKFCYRHRKDLKCKRQANEPSMEQLQSELENLSQSDQQAISHVWSLFSAAPAKHRNLMLQGILAQCCFPQLSFISANVRDLIKIDFLSALPDELAFNILCHLDTASLCKAAQVSQRWRSLADDDVVWHKMCEQHIDRKCTKCGWGLPLLEQKRLRIEKRKIQLRASSRGLNQWSPDITPAPEEASSISQEINITRDNLKRSASDSQADVASKRQCSSASRPELVEHPSFDSSLAPRKRPWKDVYKDRYKVGTAWKHGRCRTKVFKGHTNGVMCLQFDDNILMSGSYDTTVKIWDVQTGQEIRTLRGHTSGIRCLQFDEKKVLTGSLDSTLKMWDWKTGTCLRTFRPHSDGIISLHFTERYVATGSRDKTVRILDQRDGFMFTLRGHTDWVNSVKIDEDSRTLFSASDDLTVKLWDLDTKECIRTFTGHVGQVQQVVPMPVEFDLDSDTVASDQDDDASSVGSVKVSDSHKEHQSSRSSFWPDDPDRPAPPRYMLTGALDSTIRLWDTHLKTSNSARETTPQLGSDFEVIPTDPLTNSHMPRAQACVRTFFGHVEGIWSLAADHLRLISGSQDAMMKVWDPRTGKCERTFTGHQGPVTCAWLSDSRVASGSEDCDVRMLCFGDDY